MKDRFRPVTAPRPIPFRQASRVCHMMRALVLAAAVFPLIAPTAQAALLYELEFTGDVSGGGHIAFDSVAGNDASGVTSLFLSGTADT